MDQAFHTVLAEYHQRAEVEAKLRDGISREDHLKQRDNFLLQIGEGPATILNTLVKEKGAKTIVEVGTSYGYSTLWFADAARATGGKVVTLDLHAYKQEYARAALERAGLAQYVEFKAGDARESLAALKGPFDFVLLDLWKDLYIPCFNLIYPKLAPGALIAADNMTSPAFFHKDAEEYRKHVRAEINIQSLLLPIGSGIELSRYTRGVEFI
jgi:predicted O-methyltransferase YrrM